MIDTHAHINFDEYKTDFELFLAEIKENDIEKVIIPATEPSDFDEIIRLCEKYDMLYAAIGVHPSEYQTYNSTIQARIYEAAKHDKVIAIGEMGLDYYYGAEFKAEQKEIFKQQLEIAQNLRLPVIIHDREAHQDTFDILNDYNLKDVIFHCFCASWEFAQKCLEKGYYIAIGGIVTFKNAKDVKETAKMTPLDKILLETDSPYLAPVPFRGRLNTPSYLKYTAQEIANIRNIDIEIVKAQTTANAKRVFGI